MRRIMGNLGNQLIVTATLTTIMAACLSSCGRPSDGNNGSRLSADGVSFDPVPIDVNIDCNYHLLQGTQRFRGTYFVIPKVKIARDREDKTAMKILPLANGNVAFDFAMNFERGTESRNTKPGLPEAQRYANTCNFEKLRASINKHYEDLQQPENKVWSLSPLPITNVEIRIDGIGKSVLLSPEGTNITTWLGDTISTSIELTKGESERLISKVSRGLGIQLVNSFKFEARETREFGSMNFKGSDVAKALQTSLGYSGPIATGIVLEADLKTKLVDAIRASSAEAVIESDSDKLSSAAESLIKLMIEKVSPEKLIARDQESNPEDDSRYDDDYEAHRRRDRLDRIERERDDWDTDKPETESEKARSIRDRLIRDVAPRKFADDVNDKPAASSRSPKSLLAPMAFKVSAVMDFLRSQSNTKVEYRIMGKLVSEIATARSKMISGHVGANDESTVELLSGEHSRNLGSELDAGKTLKLMVAGRKVFVPEAESKDREYLTKNELLVIRERDDVTLDFPQLVDWGRKIYEFTPNEITGPRAYIYDSVWNPFNWAFYVWGKAETKIIETLTTTEDAENASTKKIRLGFSRIAKSYTWQNLKEMASVQNETDPFTVKDEGDGSFSITAKIRLGAVTMENTEQFGKQEFVVTRYFQEKWSAWSNDRLQSSVTWSNRKETKSVPAGRSIVSIRLLQGDGVPDVTFEEAK